MNLTKIQKRKLIKLCDDIQEINNNNYSVHYLADKTSTRIYIYCLGDYFKDWLWCNIVPTESSYQECYAKLKEILNIMKGN